MRILYIINAFTYAGAEKLVYNLALRLSERLDYIGIIALYAKGDRTEKEMLETLSQKGIDTKILGKRAGKDRLRSIKEIYSFVKRNRVQLIHAHCPLPMALGKAAGKLNNLPVICTVHSTRGYELDRVTSWMVRTYVSIGEATDQYMKENLKLPEMKICRIYNAIDADRFKKAEKREDFWYAYGGVPGQQSILNVARVSSPKNQLCLLRALGKMVSQGNKQAKLYILGDYDQADPVYRELERYISENALTEYVRFLGMRDNVEDFLANAACFVMTSWYEGFSVAFLEAVVSGCAVVTTELPFVKEVNAIAKCATVIPQDDADRLADILTRRAYQRQSKETITAFSEKFSLEKFADAHYALYTSIWRGKKEKTKA